MLRMTGDRESTKEPADPGGPTTTLGTDLSQLLAQGCGTAFQLVLGK